MKNVSIASPGVRTRLALFLKTHIIDILFWAGLALFFILRFSDAGLIEFKNDEYTALKYAYLNIHHKIALVGLVSSTGLSNPPFFIYLLSIPVLLSTDPILITSFVNALNACAIVMLYFFIKKWFNKNIAIITTLLAASAPWAILYSRKIWAQDCLFPFMMIFYGVFFSNLEKYSRGKTYVLFLLVAVITQLHMSAWFLYLPIGAFFVIAKIKIRPVDFVAGICITVLAYLPYLYFHYSSQFVNFISVMQNRPHAFLPPENIIWSFIITCGFRFSYFLGDSGFEKFFSGKFIRIPYVFFSLYLALTIIGFFYCSIVVANKIKLFFVKKENIAPSHQILLLFLLIFGCTHLCFFVFKIQALPHYNIVFYPILPLLTACFIEYGLHSRTIIKKAAWALLVFVIISNFYFITAFNNFIGTEPLSINGDYGIPYKFVEKQWQKYLDPQILGNPNGEQEQSQ
jgi:hypothetical protein